MKGTTAKPEKSPKLEQIAKPTDDEQWAHIECPYCDSNMVWDVEIDDEYLYVVNHECLWCGNTWNS